MQQKTTKSHDDFPVIQSMCIDLSAGVYAIAFNGEIRLKNIFKPYPIRAVIKLMGDQWSGLPIKNMGIVASHNFLWVSDYDLGTRFYCLDSQDLIFEVPVGANGKVQFDECNSVLYVTSEKNVFAINVTSRVVSRAAVGRLVCFCSSEEGLLVYRVARSRASMRIVLHSTSKFNERVVGELKGFGIVSGGVYGDRVIIATAGGESLWVADLSRSARIFEEKKISGYPMKLLGMRDDGSLLVWVASKECVGIGCVILYNFEDDLEKLVLEHEWGKAFLIDDRRLLFASNGCEDFVSIET